MMIQRTARRAFGEFAAVFAAVLVMGSCPARGAPAEVAVSQSNWHEVRGGAWPVPAEVVAEMAGAIEAEAGRHRRPETVRPMNGYIMQYQGQTNDGKRSIQVSGACRMPPGTTADDLSARFHIVFDGGNCYFDATYDPSRHGFTQFSFHGRA
jgi:hypothetical protein